MLQDSAVRCMPIKTSSTKGATDADNTACIGYDLIFLQKFSVYRKKTFIHICKA